MSDQHITFHTGVIFDSDAQALVNPVNCVGVMRSGLALAFKQKYRENFSAYVEACGRRQVILGRMFTTRCPSLFSDRYIINFPTKDHWRMPSRLCDIEAGLQDLRRTMMCLSLRSIAIPALGCGRGGLAWDDVRPLMIQHLHPVTDCAVLIYEPAGHGARVATGTTNTPSSR